MISYVSQETAKRYSRIRYVLFAAEILLTALFLFIMAAQGPSVWIRDFSVGITENAWLSTAIYFLIFGILYVAVSFPLDLYQGFSLEQKFSLSTQNFSAWFKDYLKRLSVVSAISFFLVEFLYLFLRRFEANWWVLAALLWITFTIVLSRVAPVLILPIFFKVKPLQDEGLRRRLLNLAQRSGSKVKGVFEIDLSSKTVKANAALAGMGRTRRILIGDTLLKDYSADEIEVVLAHELGHHKHGHILKFLAFGAASAFAGFYIADRIFGALSLALDLEGPADLAGFPLLLLILFFFTLFILPLQNGLGRAFERQADSFAIGLTNNPDAFIATMRKLGEQNLADFSPNRAVEIFLYDHPPLSKRIRMALDFKNR